MIRTHKVTSAVIAFALVGVIVFGAAGSAQASIWPKGFAPKQFMINVLSSMLAGTNPDGALGTAKRAVINADQQFDHSWEALDELWKKDAKNVPTSYSDYVIQRQEYFQQQGIKGIQGQKGTETNTGSGTKYVKPMKAPATKIGSLARKGIGLGLGGGLTVAWGYRGDIGSSASSFLGIDAQNAVCQSNDELGAAAKAVDWITGQDCNAWAVAQGFDPNIDAIARPDGWKMYPLPWGCTNDADLSTCYTAFTTVPNPTDDSGTQTITLHIENGKAQGNVGVIGWCLPATGKPVQADTDQNSGYSFNSDGMGQTNTIKVTCKSPSKLYALTVQSGLNPTTSDPDALTGSTLNKSWFSKDSPNYTPGENADPERTFLCTYTMPDGSTQTKETDTFKETDADVPSPVCPATDASGQAPTDVGVDEVNKDDGSKQNVYSEDTSSQYQDWWQKYPECREGACALDLIHKASGKSCFYDNATSDACMDWMTDPNKTSDYQCMYGGHKVDLTECNAYGNVFNPQKVLAGSAYTDPATGESTTGQSSPGAAADALSRGFTDPQDFSGCLDKGWAQFNPVEWVLTPIQCGMQWAFAPSEASTVQTSNAIQNSWNDKAPGEITNAVAGWKLAPAPTGCDIPVRIFGVDLRLADACPGGPLAGLATTSQLITGAMIAVVCFFASRRVVRSWYGDTDGGPES